MEQIKTTSKTKTILFVDNDKGLVHSIREYLELEEISTKFGVNFIFASNVHEALKKTAEMKIDLVILEILLPIINGYYFIDAIKKENNELPIVAYTKLKSSQDLAKIAASNVDNIFLKDLIKMEDLIETIVKIDNHKTELDKLVPELKSQIKAMASDEGRSHIKIIRCPRCNLILAADSHFCNNCGQKIFKKTKKIEAKSELAKK
jgi:CheY-like chemotaxis protein